MIDRDRMASTILSYQIYTILPYRSYLDISISGVQKSIDIIRYLPNPVGFRPRWTVQARPRETFTFFASICTLRLRLHSAILQTSDIHLVLPLVPCLNLVLFPFDWIGLDLLLYRGSVGSFICLEWCRIASHHVAFSRCCCCSWSKEVWIRQDVMSQIEFGIDGFCGFCGCGV